jgi:protein-disulfide isomerase
MHSALSLSPLAWMAAAVLATTVATAGPAQPAKAAATEPAAALAYLGDRPIAAREVEARLKARLFRVRQEQYDLQVEGIREVAFELLQEQEAAKLGLTRAAYYTQEVTNKVAEPKDEEVQQIFTTYRQRLPRDENEAKAEVRRVLRERNAGQQAEAFKNELLSRTKLRIMLEPPRLDVPLEKDDPVVGAADAPVTLVEFSDFQCPYCQRGQTILKQLRGEYGDRVRMIFKQLPLGIHAQARFAAEVALCANDQGKYWEAREWLFGRRDGITPEAAKQWAAGAAVDTAVFSTCVDTHVHAPTIDADLATATALATTSTPVFFVNGRLLEGAQPIERFRAAIDDELARATPRDPAQPSR